jgi:hypothetical protein
LSEFEVRVPSLGVAIEAGQKYAAGQITSVELSAANESINGMVEEVWDTKEQAQWDFIAGGMDGQEADSRTHAWDGLLAASACTLSNDRASLGGVILALSGMFMTREKRRDFDTLVTIRDDVLDREGPAWTPTDHEESMSYGPRVWPGDHFQRPFYYSSNRSMRLLAVRYARIALSLELAPHESLKDGVQCAEEVALGVSDDASLKKAIKGVERLAGKLELRVRQLASERGRATSEQVESAVVSDLAARAVLAAMAPSARLAVAGAFTNTWEAMEESRRERSREAIRARFQACLREVCRKAGEC